MSAKISVSGCRRRSVSRFPRVFGAVASLFQIAILLSSCGIPTSATALPNASSSPIRSVPTPSAEATFTIEPDSTGHTLSPADIPAGSYLGFCAFAEEDLSDPDAWPSVFISDLQGVILGRITAQVCGRSDLSPDARLVAIEARPDGPAGPPSVLILDLSTGSSTLPESGRGCAFPSWSPDSAMLAVSCDLDIYVLDLTSDRSVSIANCRSNATACTDPQWSPDGSSILVFRATEFTPNPGLYRVPSDCLDAPETCLSSATFFLAGTPPYSWSPDAGHLVYVTFAGGLAIADARGRLIEELPVPDSERIESIAWSPDGSFIAATVHDATEGRVTYQVPIDGGDWTRLTSPPGDAYVLFWWEKR